LLVRSKAQQRGEVAPQHDREDAIFRHQRDLVDQAAHEFRRFRPRRLGRRRLIARPIQVDGAGSTSIDLLASRISMVDVSETQEIGFILARMKVLSASTSSTRMRRM
jgi:hypothetical protein